jgi:DNA ligase-1
MDALERFNSLLDELAQTNGRIEKENVLKSYENDEDVKYILHFIFNTYITTGISKKKLNKIKVDVSTETNNINYNIIDLLKYLREHNTGKDSDLQVVGEYLHNRSAYSDLIKAIVSKDMKLGFQPLTLKKVYGPDFVPLFELMLAEKYYDAPEKYLPKGTPFIITTKLDGIRCICFNSQENEVKFLTRQGQPIYGLNDIEKEVSLYLEPGYVYDGELLLKNDNNLESKDLYRATVKVVNSDITDKKNVIFHIFDKVALKAFQDGFSPIPASERKADICKELSAASSQWLEEVGILYEGEDQSQIQFWLDEITSKGGEGIMLNLSEGPYECKRSREILKVKKMQSADLKCIGMEEGSGVNKGRLGALKVEFPAPDGNTYIVDVGGGFKQDERIEIWANPDSVVGKIIEVQYFEVTQNEKGGYSLRFPVFKCVREDKEEPSLY